MPVGCQSFQNIKSPAHAHLFMEIINDEKCNVKKISLETAEESCFSSGHSVASGLQYSKKSSVDFSV